MHVSQLILAAAAATFASGAAMSAETVNVGPFRSVELRDGGHVTVRAGATQRVTLVEGDTRFTRFRVDHGDQLVVETHCNSQCPDHYRIRVEIVSPGLRGLAVEDGGSIVAEGAFPAQATFSAAVSEGGHVDARAIPAAQINAAVNEGGIVMVTATGSLKAAVNDGGNIQYWGNPSSIHRAISGGGVIAPGGSARGVTHASAVAPVAPVAPVTPVAGTRMTHDSDDDYDSDTYEDDYDDVDDSDSDEDDDSDE